MWTIGAGSKGHVLQDLLKALAIPDDNDNESEIY